MDKWINVIRYGALVLLFLLIYMLVLRPIKRQIVTTFQELPKQLGMAKSFTGGFAGECARHAPPRRAMIRPALRLRSSSWGILRLEAKQAVMLKKNLLEKVKKEPATASRLIQNWMRQEGKS